MRRNTLAGIVVCVCLLPLLTLRAGAPAPPVVVEDDIAVYFSPDGGCEQAIVNEINAAKNSIDVQAFSFTNRDIAKALLAAKKRKVRVRILLDASNETAEYSAANFLFNSGMIPGIDGEHAIAHNKIMIIDAKTLITGSFNFTNQAEEKNAENLLIIKNKPKIIQAYTRNFTNHMEHSKAYKPEAK